MADPASRPNDSDIANNPFTEVPVEVVVCVGTAHPLVRDLLSLKPSSVLQLDRKVSDPVDLIIGNKLIARGELEEQPDDPDGNLVVRLVEVADLKSGV